ncbi:MAG: beta-lactamase family protein, partial [Granulosicoccus sp.]|nr:beta-lactamase family protein [Granulosicoccus sp.]
VKGFTVHQFPPDSESQVTLANWRSAPFNRWAFHHVSELVPSAVIKNNPDHVSTVQTGSTISLPDIELDGSVIKGETFLEATHTDGLVILADGQQVYESFANNMTLSDPHILMSVSKSMLGLLVGILVEQGVLDLDATVESYLPELQNSGFAGATLQQLLDMRTAVVFDEDYLATSGDIIEYRKATNWNPLEPGEQATDLRAFFATLDQSAGPHGGDFDYKSPCTDLLGWVIERASGQRYCDLFSQLLWSRIGAAYPGMITVDRLGAPRVAGGMSITTHDLARVGQMLVDDGAGIVPTAWIDDMESNGDPTAWDKGSFAEHFPGLPMHYRSKWYVLRGESPILFCLGIHGQYLFVDRKAKVVLAKHSSAPQALDPRAELMMIRMFEAVRSLVCAGVSS